MIENIRKYTGLMIVVLVLLFIGLVFLESSAQNLTSGKPVMEVAGRQISVKDFRRLAVNPLQLPDRIGNSFLSQDVQNTAKEYLGEDAITFSRGYILQSFNFSLDGSDPTRFLANRLAVQKAGLEYGATPGPEEIQSFIREVLFADEEGSFDQKQYDEFIDDRIGSLGIGIKGFNEYIRDLLTAQKLNQLISGGIEADRDAARALYRNNLQTISAQQISLESSSYENEQTPTEEEIKAYWEENQNNYNTDERRIVSYVFFEPDWEAALAKAEATKKAQEEAAAKLKEDARKAEEEDAARLKEEAEKAQEAANSANESTPPAPTAEEGEVGAQGEPAETSASSEVPANTPPVSPPTPKKPEPPKLSAQDKLTATQRQEALSSIEIETQVLDFYDPLVDGSKKTFEDSAKELGINITTTEFFSRSSPIDPFGAYSSTAQSGRLADIVFNIPTEAKDDQRITDPISTANGWYVCKLEKVEESRPLTFEEAKVKATVDLKKGLARIQLAEEAPAIREKLVSAVAEGKTFEEAAKAAELTIQRLPGLTQPRQRGGVTPPAFEAARFTTPKTIAKTKFLPDSEQPERALIVYVEGREVITDEQFQTGLENFIKQQNSSARLFAFQSWLRERYDENDVRVDGEILEQLF